MTTEIEMTKPPVVADADVALVETARRRRSMDHDHPHYKWIVLSNTTFRTLLATINASIVLISLPAIFRGIGLNPLAPGNVSYLLWMLMGYLVVTAVLVVPFGRLGDMFGRVRIYNLGFAVFTVAAIALSFDPLHGGGGALWLIGWRVVQGVGGAMLMASSSAILTAAFPANQRGMALGVNMVGAVAGSFLGLLIGGFLSEWHWKAVFWVGVPIGIIGTIWSIRSLKELGVRTPGRLDWAGTLSFGIGLTVLLTGITYGIQPYGDSTTGWTSPWVLGAIAFGLLSLVAFCFIELHVESPMVDLRLFRSASFGMGNLAGLMSSMGRGGLQFMLIIWLQGTWWPDRSPDCYPTASARGRSPSAACCSWRRRLSRWCSSLSTSTTGCSPCWCSSTASAAGSSPPPTPRRSCRACLPPSAAPRRVCGRRFSMLAHRCRSESSSRS